MGDCLVNLRKNKVTGRAVGQKQRESVDGFTQHSDQARDQKRGVETRLVGNKNLHYVG